MTISAKIVADSINHKGIRLTTLLLHYPRYILPELNTHRMFSRNSASSRAVPTERIFASIQADPIYPHHGKNCAGMQAKELLNEEDALAVDQIMDEARFAACGFARKLHVLGLHKQSCNRIIEPFTHISTLVSATEWNNFFALRLHEDAQPEIQALAKSIKTAMDNSKPVFKEDNEWHLPFISGVEEELTLKEKLMLSVAKCATISYARTEQEITLQKAAEIFERLTKSTPIHASPFEHQAKPIADSNEASHLNLSDNELWCGNFRGWMQYRHVIPNNYLKY